MIEGYRFVLTVIAGIGAALTGGVFFAFSDFVMRALRRLPDREGAAAMQAINRAAPSPLFMTLLFGTAIVCLSLGASALPRRDQPGATHHMVGACLYLVTIVVTMAYHVPRNDALARVDPGRRDAGEVWRSYAGAWTTWNHVRTSTSFAAAVALVLALRAG